MLFLAQFVRQIHLAGLLLVQSVSYYLCYRRGFIESRNLAE